MSEADEMRALDRDIALLLGWEHYPEGDYRWLPPGCLPVNECPAYSSTWEGFGLLVEEAKRRGWEFSAAVWGRAGDGVPQAFITWRGRRLNNPWERAGSDIRHAFALAMRDALRAGNEAP